MLLYEAISLFCVGNGEESAIGSDSDECCAVCCGIILVLCMSPDIHWSLGHTVDLLLGAQIIKKPA